MANRIKLDIIMYNGIINLGKYTFPNMPALDAKTEEVLLKDSEK